MKIKDLLLGSVPSSGLLLLALQNEDVRKVLVKTGKKAIEVIKPAIERRINGAKRFH